MDREKDESRGQRRAGDATSTAAPGVATWAIATLFRRHRFIGAFTIVMAIAAILVSLLLPKWYLSSARLLLPDRGGVGAAALLGDLSSAAESLLGARGDYVRYLAILTSRSTFESVVDEFDLVTVYDLQDSDTPRLDAVDVLRENVEFTVDDEYDYLSIEVLDRDPVRAAEMANYFVERLNITNTRLASQAAAGFRRYAENRYLSASRERAQLLDSLKSFQDKYGVFDLEAQTTAYFEQLANLRQAALEVEIQHEALQERLGSDNPTVERLAKLASTANRKYEAALAGKERVLPVPSSSMPDAIREYADLTLERTIQERILEVLAPMVEQARFEEMREVQAVQVLDPAIPPRKKARPQRTIIVVVSTFSALVLALFFVLGVQWWSDNHHRLIKLISNAASNDERP